MKSPIYLDNSTTARPSEKVVSSMMPFLTTHWGSPTTPHQKGQELYPFLSQYYKTLYTFIGAQEKDQVILTSSGTEAINHVISSVYRDVTLSTGKNQYLTSKLDEAASIMAVSHLEVFGCVGKMIEAPNGKVSVQTVADSLSPRTALVSLSWANGLTGVIQPIAEIAELCHQRGIRFHVDVTHAIGKLYYDIKDLQIDYITYNGEQLHGPKGTGVLVVREGVRCSPFLFGSADQGGMRAGSLNMPGLAGIACAAEEALDSRDLLCTEVSRLRNQLERGIIQGFPQAYVCFKEEERLPHCSTIIFPGIANEALLFYLNRKGVCASIGGGSFQQLGFLLSAAGIPQNASQQAISFSLSRYTTEDEIERATQIIVDAASTLAHFSKVI